MRASQRVDTETLNKPRPRKIRGVDVTVYFGQDDMPIRIRGEYKRDRKKFVIAFEYDAPEEAMKKVPYEINHVSLLIGQNSDRLFEVELDVDSMNVDAVRLMLPEVGKVLDDLAKQTHKGLNRIDNYVAASGAFKQVQPQLETAFAQ